MIELNIRQGTIEEFKTLWNNTESTTYKYFLNNMKKNIIEFWTIEEQDNLIAELYIFWDSIDKDEANGINRAYLCAFRVNKNYQGKGYGSLLMKRVIERIKEKKFNEVTIGIDNKEFEKLKSMYQKFGFTKLIKNTYIDNHYLDRDGNPTKYDESYMIMIKTTNR